MGRLFVVRHSLSYYNEIGKFAGNQDIPLSKKGISDSILLGKKFQETYPNANIDYVFTSTLSRSFDTAVLMLSEMDTRKIPIKISRQRITTFAKPGMLPIVAFSELNERNYGILQDMDKCQVEKSIDPVTLLNWRRNFYDGPKQGETFQRVVSRVARFYFSVLEPILKDKDVLLVAHQNTIRALYYLIYNIDKTKIDKVEFQNSDIWTFDFQENIESIVPKNVIIMASGKGSRLKEYTENMPKPLLHIGGKELISYPVEYFSKAMYNITITYSYLKDCWGSYISTHPNVQFCYTSGLSHYWQDFIKAYAQTVHKSNYFIVMSGDMLFDYSIVEDAMREHITKGNHLTVVLNDTYGKWKKWEYEFSNQGTIKDIKISVDKQPFERYFLILNKDTIEKFIAHTQKEGFSAESEYGSGACFIVKTLLDMNVKVNYKIYDKFLININDSSDFETAEKYIARKN